MHDTVRNLAPLKVLLIEDNPMDAKRINIVLGAIDNGPLQMTTSVRLSEALTLLAENDFDVALLDLTLPDTTGIETFVSLQASAPMLPIVILTGRDDDRLAFEAIRLGAQDYLTKNDFDGKLVARALHYAVERKRLTEDLKAERQRSFLVDKLRAAKEKLEKQNRRLSRLYKTAYKFVDNVSHEFRTPLTVIKEYVCLVSDGVVGEVNEEQTQMLATVADRADDLNTMVDDMLDVSRLEAGMLGVWRKNCRAADIIDRVRPNLEKKAAIRNVELEIDLDANLPEIFCDAEKAGRVVINLTVNAIKFSGQPGRVRLWARRSERTEDIVIGVTDNGSGIDHENLEAIFDRFKQVGPDPRQSTKGFGLGLNIAKELVDLNFGQMNVESQVGKGSTFSFTVPLSEPSGVVRRYLARTVHLHNGSSVVSVATAQLDTSTDATLCDDVDAFFNYSFRGNDLLFRVDTHRWLLLLSTAAANLENIFARLMKSRNEANRNRPQGLLPDFEFLVEGSWSVANNIEDVLDCVNDVLETQETIYV